MNGCLLGVENISSHAHKVESWYLLGILFKISNKHPGSVYAEVSLESTPPGWGIPVSFMNITA